MRVLLAAFGSRGDVQPIVALGKGLKAAGYETVVAAGVNFRALVEDAGLEFEPFTEDLEAAVNSDIGKEWLGNSSHNPRQEIANMRRMAAASGPALVADLLRMIDRADVFASGMMTLAPLDALTRLHGKRHLMLWLSPMVPTSSGHAGMQALLPRRRNLINLWFGYVIESVLWGVFSGPTNALRKKLGLRNASRFDFTRIINQTPSLNGYSTHVVPRPPDWPSHHHLTGYWHEPAPDDWTPPPELQAFLDAGEPPVYIGFGSMSTRDPGGTATLMIEALKQAGKRGILHTGWAGLHAQDLPESVYLIDHAPHAWLFPRMAGVVHHGGAGTTASALRAGVPSLIVAHIGDQPFWGRRVYELGVGAQPLRRYELTPELLASRIKVMTSDAGIRERAAEMGRKLAAEDGIGNAVRAFEAILFGSPRAASGNGRTK